MKCKHKNKFYFKEWKRLAAMTPEEYFAEYKAKQEAAKKAREEEERKRKEAEEKQKAEAAKKAAENPTAENEEKSEDTPKGNSATVILLSVNISYNNCPKFQLIIDDFRSR